MRRLLCAVLALVLIWALGGAFAEGENLLVNGDFAENDGDLPKGWRREMWLTDAGVSLLSVDADGLEGSCVTVKNVDANDARFAQTVRVEPDSLYRLSGMIRAEHCDMDGYGASLSIEGVFVYSDGVYDTGGEWQHAELYGRTGPDQRELTVFARVGGYGQLCEGKASFDELSLVKVDKAPAGVAVQDFFREETASNAAASSDDSKDTPKRYTESWLLFTFCYALAVIAFARKRGRNAEPMADGRRRLLFVMGLLAAFILRLVLAVRVRGYNTDINCFTAWSERMYSLGPTRFYDPDYFCDYPPLYMLLLWLVAALRRLLGWQTGDAAYLMLLKLLPMLADMAGAALVWRVARRRMSEGSAAMLGMLYALNPAAIANSAAWGQIDAMLALAIALCALNAADGKYGRALIWFGAAILIKPQAALFAPVGLAAIVAGVIRAGRANRPARLRSLALGVAGCLGLIYAVSFICCIGKARSFGETLTLPVSWLVELYTGTVQGYRYVTVNTLNLHYLLGLNWGRAEDHAAAIILAWGLFALSYAGCIFLTGRSLEKPHRLLLTGGLLIVLVCTFGPMIHERYVFPGLLLMTLAFAWEKDKRLLISLTVLTCTLFLNEILVLQGGMTAANYGHLQSSEHWLNCIVCVVNVLNALFLGWTAFDLCVRDRVLPLSPARSDAVPSGAYTLSRQPDWRLGLRRVDALLIASVTLLYSVLAFTNLGVTNAPQTGWTSSQSGESVVFDLGREQTFRMTYFGGICNSTFAVELSNDGENWSEK